MNMLGGRSLKGKQREVVSDDSTAVPLVDGAGSAAGPSAVAAAGADPAPGGLRGIISGLLDDKSVAQDGEGLAREGNPLTLCSRLLSFEPAPTSPLASA